MISTTKIWKREADEKRRMAMEMRASIRHPIENGAMTRYADMLDAEAAAIERRLASETDAPDQARPRRGRKPRAPRP